MNTRTFFFSSFAALAAVACSAAPADAEDNTDETSSGLSICADTACGPALGAPTLVCADGSVGGSTGRCIKKKKGAACHWEIRSCPTDPRPPPTPPPAVNCATGACGPALGMPSYLCSDGKTVAGPGACVDKGGVCGWEIISCPTPPPADCSGANACGPAPGMPNYLCSDGKTVAGPAGCVDKGGGVCGWNIISCPK